MRKALLLVLTVGSVITAAITGLVLRDDSPAEQVARPAASPFDASRDYFISRNPKIMLVEGVVVAKDIKDTKGHPGIRYSTDPTEAEQQQEFASKHHFWAEFEVQVERWTHGDGPPRLIVVKGVNFEDQESVPGMHTAGSGAWVDRSKYESIAVGGHYRFYVIRTPGFEASYYSLASNTIENLD